MLMIGTSFKHTQAGPSFSRCTEAACRVLQSSLPYKVVAQHSQADRRCLPGMDSGRCQCWPEQPPNPHVMWKCRLFSINVIIYHGI